ncbi:MAG: dihydroorotate oxidase [Candidatus Woesearchaeota archaeon]
MQIAGVILDSYVMNASGPNDTTLKELEAICDSDAGAIVTKSVTILPRDGNREPRYARLEHGSIQAMGLPNDGYEAMVERVRALGGRKPIIASIAGMSIEEYAVMARAFDGVADLIELNLSCPNVGKRIIGYDFAAVEALLTSLPPMKTPIGFKLPSYYEPHQYDAMSTLIRTHGVSFVTCINSIGHTLVIDADTRTSVLAANNGYGGLSGAYIKPIALANVRMFSERLDVPIIGVGGISTGRDAFEFLLAGASAVQVGTVFEHEGPSCFSRINGELDAMLKEHGLNMEDARGSLDVRSQP